MAEEPDPHFEDVFPAQDLAAHWVVMLCVASNDLQRLDRHVHEAIQRDDGSAGFYYRLIVAFLAEFERAIAALDTHQAVRAFADRLPDDAQRALDVLVALYKRADDEPRRSWANTNLGLTRHVTFHYPWVGSQELGAALRRLARENARADVYHADKRVVVSFADAVMAQIALGDITKPEGEARLREIINVAQQVLDAVMTLARCALAQQLADRHVAADAFYVDHGRTTAEPDA